MDTLVYENFSLDCVFDNDPLFEGEVIEEYNKDDVPEDKTEENTGADSENVVESETKSEPKSDNINTIDVALRVKVNGEDVILHGKSGYIFVDIFDFIDFDLKAGAGRAVVTTINGENAQYSQPLNQGDVLEIYWKEN